MLAAGHVACGGSAVRPTPTGPAPTLSCPAAVQVLSHDGQQQDVAFTNPSAQGGEPPVTVACVPGSGSPFGLGANSVTCTATDALSRTASCSFAVVVTAVAHVSKVRFVAFGDSLTEGITSPDAGALLLNLADSYPYQLQTALTARYIDQPIQVINEGKAGEPVNDTGKKRFPLVLDADRPEVVLVLDGANDLLKAASPPPFGSGDGTVAIPLIINALREMVGEARDRGVPMLLATFPPQNANGSRGLGAPTVPELNDEIRRLAAQEGVVLVDLYAGLGGTPTGWIGVDGLHPTGAGYGQIAKIWFDAIQKQYEVTSGGASLRPSAR